MCLCVCLFKSLYIKESGYYFKNKNENIYLSPHAHGWVHPRWTSPLVPWRSWVSTLLSIYLNSLPRPTGGPGMQSYCVLLKWELGNTFKQHHCFSKMLSEISIASLILNSKPFRGAENGYVGMGRALWSNRSHKIHLVTHFHKTHTQTSMYLLQGNFQNY